MKAVAIVGAGWAGLAAAVAAARQGHEVTLYEASRSLGGRARSLEVALPEGASIVLDNGQHILAGAYVETLRMMETVGVAPAEVLHRMPLTMRFPDGGGIAFAACKAPWDALAGIVAAKGWTWLDRWSLLRAAVAWRLAGFRCDPAMSVAQLCRGLTPRAMRELIEPLCVSALNTPAELASAEVFLRVMRDALFREGHRGGAGSNLLVPTRDLGQVFPDAALSWLQRHGADLRLGHRVHALARERAHWEVDGERFEQVLLACAPWDAARLVASSGVAAEAWLSHVGALRYEAIATVYARGGPALPLPLMALRDGPAQFVFDRARFGAPAGTLAFVVSASEGDRESLQSAVVRQAAALGWDVQPLQTVVEKRATFACVPGMKRPGMSIAPGLLACGDYVAGPYPATIEGAVRSALAAADEFGRGPRPRESAT
ncbi:MAG TPA: hydroxysqualene dehydroxylase HpnE [Ramlibacter sp.]|uniref:hydroxysqualene dehydroxylase HpnE n=1 Tax=Ramlibacter sp. TaxID=1917967 RepID=UPI002C3348F6|nr:hydroxysqualene dehydroxylase HpnE [Ramlibacter sp.]HVZ43466.1 hydroxysqualene dehydroxylase HpnE [Ramlibacter sp.]